MWDVASEERLAVIRGGNINGLMFSPDGERLVGRYYPQAAIWDAWTGDRLLTISGHSGDVFGVAFSRDGTRLATGSADGTARNWDAESGEELVRLSGHGGLVALVDFSPDGTRLLTGGGDGTARVWDVSETAGAEVWSEKIASGWVGGLEYETDGTRLVTSDGGGGWELDPSTGERLTPIGTAWEDVSSRIRAAIASQLPATAPACWTWSPGRSSARSRSQGGSRASSTARTGPSSRPVSAIQTSGAAVRCSGTRRRAGDCEPWALRTPEAILGLAFSRDGEMLALLSNRGRLEVWAVDTGERLMSIKGHPGNGVEVAFLPDDRLVSVGGDGGVVWEVPSGKRLLSLVSGSKLNAVAVKSGRGADRHGGRGSRGDDLGRRDRSRAPQPRVARCGHGRRLQSRRRGAGDGRRERIARVHALRVGDLVQVARERLNDTPNPTGPSAPTPAVSTGPQGAFRVAIAEEDLLREGLPASDVANEIGDYTLALADGMFRLTQRLPDGSARETSSGTYGTSGTRITLTEAADALCAGNRFSAVWRSDGPVLRLSDCVGYPCNAASRTS